MFLAPTLVPRTVEDLTQRKNEEAQISKRELQLEAQVCPGPACEGPDDF